ncbi:MAG TPA: S-methyl-5-thioribose-1-phosphate isomerase [Candidatus Binataceae bacterium]|nr:S-methyl-5-thioribose-1-phosphate isomerase [Candidatus Binataceae bacterium]
MAIKTLRWSGERVLLLDQRLLPEREVYREYSDYRGVARAIATMVVRGAPAIGVAAAMGVALGLRGYSGSQAPARFATVSRVLMATRPTAVNLAWAVARMGALVEASRALSSAALFRRLRQESLAIYREDIAANRALGRLGADLITANPARILTHCNAGALATAGYGTALGIVRALREAGRAVSVFADETRPFLQGARLTAWELRQDRIAVTVLADNMAGLLMARDMVDCVIVGTDRVAANGDVANKIGTYPLAVLARRHQVPFYVAAPLSSIDLNCPSGAHIPIEERAAAELATFMGRTIVPAGARVFNPAFDVTPAALVTAIVTERGVARSPYRRSLLALKTDQMSASTPAKAPRSVAQ